MKRWLSIWLPNWPIQRLRAERPTYRRQPLILWQEDARRGQVIARCSVEASRRGARRGMPLAEVRALGIHHVEPWDRTADRQAWLALLQACEQFSPTVWEDEWPGADPSGLMLDVTGTGVHWGGELGLVKAVEQVLQQHHDDTRLALAETRGAAWAWARFSRHAQSDEPPSSAVANASPQPQSSSRHSLHTSSRSQRRAAPPSPFPPGPVMSWLPTLPVACLRLSATTRKRLHELGIHRVDQLLCLPRAGLASRLGSEVLVRLDQALGHCVEMGETHSAEPTWSVETVLEYATDQREWIETMLHHLTHHLAQQLAGQQLGVLQLTCQLQCERPADRQWAAEEVSKAVRNRRPHAPRGYADQRRREPPGAADDQPPQPDQVVFQVNFFRPTHQPTDWWALLQTALEQITWPGPVTHLQLTASSTARVIKQQQWLWPEITTSRTATTDPFSSPVEAQALARLLERLTNRLPPQSVCGVRPVKGILPEETYRTVPWAPPRPPSPLVAPESHRTAVRIGPALRPLQLVHPPRALTQVQTQADGSPTTWRLEGTAHRVLQAWGPERLETAWWRGTCVRRDYYRVVYDSGRQAWLFYDLQQGTWYLHGYFS